MVSSAFLKKNKFVLRVLELSLSFLVIAGSVVYGYESAIYLSGLDWALSETFYELINRILLIVIGLELARLLTAHNLRAIPELLGFVIARKLFKPDSSSLDILFGVFAFTLVLVAQRFFLSEITRKLDVEDGDVIKKDEPVVV